MPTDTISILEEDIIALVKTVGLKRSRRSHSIRLESNKRKDPTGEECLTPAGLQKRLQERRYIEEHGYPEIPQLQVKSLNDSNKGYHRPSTKIILSSSSNSKRKYMTWK